MAYAAWSVVFGEQPSAAKWNILGTNDASFNDGTGLGDRVVTGRSIDTASIVYKTTTPSGNSDSTGSYADWGASTTLAVPTWANRAIVVASIQNIYNVTSTTLGTTRVVIGSDNGASSGRIGQVTTISANEGKEHTWMDQITLTGTGSVTLKNQVVETTGSGAMRVDTSSKFDWIIFFLKA